MKSVLTMLFVLAFFAVVPTRALTRGNGGGGLSVSGPTSSMTLPVPATGLTLWLRADSNVTHSDSAVSAWGDLSGNDHSAAQSSPSAEPILKRSQMNGKPVIHFSGAQSLILPDAPTLGIQNSAYECFIVARSSSSSIVFLLAGNSISNYEFHLNLDAFGATGGRFIPNPDVGINQGSEGEYANGSPHVFSMQAHGSGGQIRIDGVNGASTSSDSRSSDAGVLYLGRRGDDSYKLNGDIAEVIMYTRILSSMERDTVEKYLALRYNITSGALPVELTSFTALRNGNQVSLRWSTATEVNNSGFAVERRVEVGSQQEKGKSDQWHEIGFIAGQGTTNAPQSYSFVDISAYGTARYRLKQVDHDGAVHYSSEVEAASPSVPAELFLGQNYPNPFNPSTVITYHVPERGDVSLTVFDALGREVETLVRTVQEAGTHSVTFHASGMASGIYLVRLQSGSATQMRKMTFIK